MKIGAKIPVLENPKPRNLAFMESLRVSFGPRRRLSRIQSKVSVWQFRPAIGWRSSRIPRHDAKPSRDEKVTHQKNIHQTRRSRRRRGRRRGLQWGWKMKKSEIGASLRVRAMAEAVKKKLNQGEKKLKEVIQKKQKGDESSSGKKCGVNHQSWSKSKARGVKKGDRLLIGTRIGFPVLQVINSEEKEEESAMLYVEQGKLIGGGACSSVIRKKKGADWKKRSRERRFGVSKSIKRVRRSVEVNQRSRFRHAQIRVNVLCQVHAYQLEAGK